MPAPVTGATTRPTTPTTAPVAAAPPTLAEIRASMQFGHLPYPEVPRSQRAQLKAIGGGFVLKAPAAAAFARLVAAAKKDGVNLVPVFGFRDIATQRGLFNQHADVPPAERAKLRAPPGFSEHHTGYALDINSRGEKMTEGSRAFRWLKAHGAEYGFENSFGKGNAQGVAFEPWHWRYVGNAESQRLFANARALSAAASPTTPAGWAPPAP